MAVIAWTAPECMVPFSASAQPNPKPLVTLKRSVPPLLNLSLCQEVDTHCKDLAF